TLALQPGGGLLEAAALDAEEILRRHRALLEGQLGGVRRAHAHLVELAAHREAGPSALDEEHGDAVVTAPGRPRRGPRGDEVEIAVEPVGDEDLATGNGVAA